MDEFPFSFSSFYSPFSFLLGCIYCFAHCSFSVFFRWESTPRHVAVLSTLFTMRNHLPDVVSSQVFLPLCVV